jgi:hypothetical protein
MAKELYVNALRDADAGVFYAESNVPGLHVEAESLDEMIEILLDVLPDLIRANLRLKDGALPRVRLSTDLAFA